MKPFLIIGIICIIVAAAFGAWFYLSAEKSSSGTSSTTSSTNPFESSNNSSGVTSNEPAQATQPVVEKAFLTQIQNSSQITLLNTVILMPYALQTWGDENKGGEALLEYSQSKGWVLVSLGGGAWDVPSLVEEGVPQAVAVQLVAKEPQ